MNILSLLKKHPHEDAELILAHLLHTSHEYIIAHPEYTVSFFNAWKFKKCVQRRTKNIPLAYITGHKEFFGYNFTVNKYTLVPRPDTEILVESVIEEIKNKAPVKILLIDVGTGSGCIPISILKTQPVYCFATDISGGALKTARHNAKTNSVSLKFFQGNLLEPVLKKITAEYSSIIITANLPYLREDQYTYEPSIQHEPKSALVAKQNGLALYFELLRQIKTLLTQSLTPVTTFFEIDPSQSQILSTKIKGLFPKADIQILKDFENCDRVIKVQIL